jgi:hypothetical protein
MPSVATHKRRERYTFAEFQHLSALVTSDIRMITKPHRVIPLDEDLEMAY